MNRVGKPEQPGAKMRPRPDASHGGAPPPVRFATSPADVDVELRPPAERAGRPALPSDHLPTRRPSVELCGKVTITRVPHPGADSTERSAPTAAARSRMIISPHSWSFAGCSHADGSNPQPSSAMVRRLTSLVVASATATSQARAYLATFASASCAIRNSAFSSDSGNRRPPHCSITGVCHSRKSGLTAGAIDYQPDPLEAPADGNVLICCSRSRSDVVIDL
jgi:hypothetical protein